MLPQSSHWFCPVICHYSFRHCCNLKIVWKIKQHACTWVQSSKPPYITPLIYQMYTYLSWYHSHYYFFSFSFHHVLYENLYWYFWTNFQNLYYHILLWEFCSHLDVSFSLTFHPQCLEIVGILLHWISFLLPIESERGYLNLNCKILTVDNSIMITNELSLPVLVIWEDFGVSNEKKYNIS